MPHLDSPLVAQHVTFRLADSLPKEALARIKDKLRSLPAEQQEIERRQQIEELMDAGHGACLLRDPAVATIVEEALLRFHGERYRLHAWVVMPNHVHVLFKTLPGQEMAKIVWGWKSFTGKEIKATLRQAGAWRSHEGPVWYREYWDRYIRSRLHYENAVRYIHDNPVKAGLTRLPEEWPWSSASGPRRRTG